MIGELEVEDAREREAYRRRVHAESLLGDRLERDPNERHRREHVALREADPDVDAPDLPGLRVVRVVVRAGEDALHPRDHRPLEPFDLRLSREDGVGLLVLADALVELARDADEVGGGQRPEREQGARVRLVEAHVALQLLEPRLPRGRLYEALRHGLAARGLRLVAQRLHLTGSSRSRARRRGGSGDRSNRGASSARGAVRRGGRPRSRGSSDTP